MDAKSFDPEYFKNLTDVQKVMYTAAFDFEKKYTKEATDESAHFAGLKEIARLKRVSEEYSKPQQYVDIFTGRTFWATENELESMHS